MPREQVRASLPEVNIQDEMSGDILLQSLVKEDVRFHRPLNISVSNISISQ